MNRFFLIYTFALLGFSLIVAPAKAEIKETRVQYLQGSTPLIGYSYADESIAGPRPGILVFSDWMGVGAFGKARGKQLATLGYRAFVADVYGNGKVAADAKEAGSLSGGFKADRALTRQRAEAALQELLKDPKVDKTKIGVIGFCFGGLVGLELVRSGASINGLVSFHGALDTPETFKAKKINGKILALHGADDPFVKPADVAAFEEEMRQSGANWELVKYGGAVHSFTNPDAGSDNSKGAAYNPVIAKRAYEAMDDFFKEVFSN